MKTSIVFIGTRKYINFFPNYYRALKENFLIDSDRRFHVFTDNCDFANWPNDVKTYKVEHMDWPFVTLLRYKFINNAIDDFSQSENCIFVDADILWKSRTAEDDLFNNKKHFAVQHPGFVFTPKMATFEKNPLSLAHVKEGDDLSTYWQGCLWGAKTAEFSKMVNTLNDRVDIDLKNGIVAIWHDESHLNRYLIDIKKDVNSLHPGFSAPENMIEIHQKFPTVALHLHKSMEEFPRFQGRK